MRRKRASRDPQPESVHVLLIDDNPDDRALVIRHLSQQFADLQVEQIASLADLTRVLEMGGFNLVITDYQLHWSDGLSILRAVKARRPDCPVVMFTGTGSEEVAVEAMKSGLDDYVLKSPKHFAHLSASVGGVLAQAGQRRSLKEAETRYRDLFDGVPVGLYRTTPGGRILDANLALVRMLGYPDRESFLAVSALDLYVNPEERQQAQGLRERDGVVSHFEAQLRRRDGTVIWVWDNSRACRGAGGQVLYYEGSLVDVTTRKQAEESLRESLAQLTTLIETLQMAVLMGDEAEHVLYVNRRLGEMFGVEPAEVLATTTYSERVNGIKALFADPEGFERWVEERLAGGEAVIGTEMALVDGRILECDYVPILMEGERRNRLWLFRDVTAHKRLEAQFLQVQKMETVGQLAGGIAHDFNNLLTAIIGYADYARRALSPGDAIRADIEQVLRSAERAAGLTRQLLAFSRRQVIAPRVVNLNDLILDLDGMLRRLIGEDVELVVLPAPDLAPVKVDPGQIEQVLVNLVVNARDAMPRGGRLAIETANVTIGEEYARDHVGAVPGEFVRLSVMDTGVGMTAEVKAHLFEPFFTTKEVGKGSGLGLATVYGIVKQHGGNAWIDSEVGQGTRVDIYLPRVDVQAERLPLRDEAGYLPVGKETVLVVEDEPMVRTWTARVLHELGYVVLQAGDGHEALRVAGEHPGKIDLLMTDVVMPQMSGKVLVERLRAQWPDLKVLFMSGYTDDTIMKHGVFDQNLAFLQKPFAASALARRLREVLNQ